jgi:CRP-like cAMP-binding protein
VTRLEGRAGGRGPLARPRASTGELLATVPLFAGVAPAALESLARDFELRGVPVGKRVVAELEVGDEAFIVLDGTADVTLGGADAAAEAIARIGPGDCIGEMALFTGELRAATVTATSAMQLLVIDHWHFMRLLRRHPVVAAHLAARMSARLRETEHLLGAVLDPAQSDAERREALHARDRVRPGRSAHRMRGALALAWRELVVSHRQELAFLMMVAFVVALVAVRGAVLAARRFFPGPENLEALLRASYTSGLLLLCASGAVSLLFFRPRVRRWVAVLFGVGMALLFNALPVLLTFDLFYRDIFTPDPHLTFSVEALYDRAEGADVKAIAAVVLFQVVYLRRFVRRVLSVLALRVLRRSPAA